MLKKILFPDFLMKLDRQLLLSRPLLWSSRLHFVSWFTLLAVLVLTGISMILSLDMLNMDFIGFYWMMASLISIAGLIIWLVYLFRHNNTKQYGNRTVGREWSNMLYHYCVLVLISSIIFVLPSIFLWRAHQKIVKNNLVEKVNILNVNSGLFPENEYSLNQFFEKNDSLHNGPSTYGASAQMEFGNYEYRKINKALWDFDTITTMFYRIQGKLKLKAAITQYLEIGKREGVIHSYSVEQIAAFYNDTLGYNPSADFEYENMIFNNKLEKVIDKPFVAFNYFGFILERVFYQIWLLIILPIFLLAITMFRNQGLKFFLVSIGVTIVLVIVNAIILGISLDDSGGRTFLVVIPIFFGVWALFLFVVTTGIFSAKHYSAFNAYCLFLFNLLLPLLPIIFISCYAEYQIYSDSYTGNYENAISNWWWENKYWIYNSGHIATLLVFVLAQQWYFKPLYERLWALPKK